MIDHSIYPPRYHLTQKPANLGDIQTRLKRRRPSLVQSRFSDDDFPEFEKNNEKATSKSSALTLVFPTFIGKLDLPHVQNSSFQNIRHLTDGSIPMPRPEFYDGAHASELLDFWRIMGGLICSRSPIFHGLRFGGQRCETSHSWWWSTMSRTWMPMTKSHVCPGCHMSAVVVYTRLLLAQRELSTLQIFICSPSTKSETRLVGFRMWLRVTGSTCHPTHDGGEYSTSRVLPRQKKVGWQGLMR